MEFPEGNATYSLCSAHTMAAGIDMLHQHACAGLSESPLGALIFPRAVFESCWLSQLCNCGEQQDFPPAPGRHTGTTHLSLDLALGDSSTGEERCFTWKMALDIEEVRVVPRGGQEPLVWSWDLPREEAVPSPAFLCLPVKGRKMAF